MRPEQLRPSGQPGQLSRTRNRMAIVSKIDLGKESLVYPGWPRLIGPARLPQNGPGANTIQYNHDHRNSSRVKAIANPETYRSSDVLRFGSNYDAMVAWLVAVTVYRESTYFTFIAPHIVPVLLSFSFFLLSTTSLRPVFRSLCSLHDFTTLLCYVPFASIDYFDPTLSFSSRVPLCWRCRINSY